MQREDRVIDEPEVQPVTVPGHSPAEEVPLNKGVIRTMVHRRPGVVVLEFSTPLKWIGLTPGQALELASMLNKQALLEKGNKRR